jgi:hypothetical protein
LPYKFLLRINRVGHMNRIATSDRTADFDGPAQACQVFSIPFKARRALRGRSALLYLANRNYLLVVVVDMNNVDEAGAAGAAPP